MGFESKFDDCTVVLEPMTTNTFLLIVSLDPRIGTHRHCSVYVRLTSNRDGNAAICDFKLANPPVRICRKASTGTEVRVSRVIRRRLKR